MPQTANTTILQALADDKLSSLTREPRNHREFARNCRLPNLSASSAVGPPRRVYRAKGCLKGSLLYEQHIGWALSVISSGRKGSVQDAWPHGAQDTIELQPKHNFMDQSLGQHLQIATFITLLRSLLWRGRSVQKPTSHNLRPSLPLIHLDGTSGHTLNDVRMAWQSYTYSGPPPPSQ